MTGLSISICFWHLEPALLEEVLKVLEEGKISHTYFDCQQQQDLKERLSSNPPDLILTDYDLPDKTLRGIEAEMEDYYTQVPLIYLVSEEKAREAATVLRRGVWDIVQKGQLYKLISSVYSSQKYSLANRERYAAEKALTESRDKYISIFRGVNDAILLFDFESRKIVDYNPKVLELFEVSEADMKNLKLGDFSAEEEGYTLDRARELIIKAAQGEVVSFEWLNKSRTGRLFWTLNTFNVVNLGGRTSILLLTRDINDQKLLEKDLLESQEHFRALAYNSTDVIMRFDRQHRHIFVNPAVELQTGISLEKFRGKSHEEMGIFPPHLVKLWEEALDQVFRSGKPHTIEFTLPVPDGDVSYEWRLYPELGASEMVDSVVGVARDITQSLRAGEALRHSEERLNLALQATHLGMWDWNPVSNAVYYSPIWFSMLGYGPDELPHELETWEKLHHPDDLDNSLAVIQRVIKDREESFEIEFRLKHKLGHYVWIRSMGRAVEKDADGNTTRLTGIHENIHQRKQEDLVKSVLFDISNAVTSTQSLDELYNRIRESLGRVVDTTNCFLALYNEKADTLTLPFMKDEKDSFSEFPARKTLTSYVIRTGEAQLIDIEREKELHRQGEIEPVGAPCISWLGVPLKHKGNTVGVFAVQSYSEDIIFTSSDAQLLEFASDQIAMAIERRRQQDDLEATQEKQRRVFEASPDPMIVVDTKAQIVDFNSAFLDVFNVNATLAKGEKIFRFIDRKDWRRSMKDFQRTWDEGYVKNQEYKVLMPDGTAFQGEASCGAIHDADGKPESMVIILKNISERKEAENRLIEAKQKAEESDKLKTAFLSNMSHEIRTPMNAIVGFSDLLSDEGLSSDERRDFIAQINQGADDLMRLIDDIIDIAKIEAGQVNVHIAECFIRDMFKELHLMFIQNIKRSGKEKVNMAIRWDWPVNELAIYTDPFRLKQILVNLLSNAVKFTEEGEILLGIEPDPGGIRFYVKDSGIGIREEKQKIIFDRFMQGHETKTKLYGGTGLGLAISKNLAEILGGKIGVDSVSGEGSTFWFTIPCNEVPLKHEAALRAPVSDVKSWEGKKLLIAEDDHSNYYFLFEALKDTGVEVLWSKDGEETLELFHENKDLNAVLMDINMPLKNGYECTRIIKDERPELPVIAQTAYAMSGEREISKQAGCDGYLSKPIKVKELLDTLAMFM